MTSSSPADALRGLLPDLYFVNASFTQMEHHRALLARLPQERRLIEFLRQQGSVLTELSLCAYDDERPGLLAKIAGTIAALGVKVHTASVFTVRDPQQPKAAIVLDTLLLSDSYYGHDRKLAPAKESRIRETLEQVLDEQITVPDLLSKAPKRPRLPLRILDIQAEPAHLRDQLALTVHVSRHHMAIFRMAAAIAALDYNTETAQIHLGRDGTRGHFFVTGKLPETGEIPGHLRLALQTNAMPCNLVEQI